MIRLAYGCPSQNPLNPSVCLENAGSMNITNAIAEAVAEIMILDFIDKRDLMNMHDKDIHYFHMRRNRYLCGNFYRY